MFLALILLVLLLLLAGHLLYITRPPKNLEGQPAPSDDEIPNHLVWMFFYCNPKDPRGWVGKIGGIGITPNFRTKDNVMVFLTLIGAIQVCAISMAILLILKTLPA